MNRQRVPAPPVAPPPLYEGRPLANPAEDISDQGLAFDLETLLDRRRVLRLIGYTGLSAGLLAIIGCGPSAASRSPGASASAGSSAGATPGTTAGTTPGTTAGSAEDCTVIVEETAGPFPGDGSNGPDVLGQSGVVRSDIRSSFGDSRAPPRACR